MRSFYLFVSRRGLDWVSHFWCGKFVFLLCVSRKGKKKGRVIVSLSLSPVLSLSFVLPSTLPLSLLLFFGYHC